MYRNRKLDYNQSEFEQLGQQTNQNNQRTLAIVPMSTNSNQLDDLMEDNPSKTKLQKFLRSIDDETMKMINNYLEGHQIPQNDGNTKSQKIKLYQDLLMIQIFKVNERKIYDGNKKIIDQLCQILKQQMGFSTLTIRQRIQKKLANVSKEEIQDHIRLQLNFTFNSKRKLVTSKNAKHQMSEQDNFGFESRNNHQQIPSQIKQEKQSRSTKCTKRPSDLRQIISRNKNNAITISSSDQRSIEQIKQQNPNQNSQNTKKRRGNIQLQQSSPQAQIHVAGGRQRATESQLMNQFWNASDHDSDDDVLIIRYKNNYKITTKKAEQLLQEILKKVKQDGKENNSIENNQKQQKAKECKQNEQTPQVSNNEDKKEKNEKSEQKNKQIISIDLCDEEVGLNTGCKVLGEKIENDAQPLDIHQYCSIQDWKLAQQNPQFSYLKWFTDEDNFLISIVNHPNADKSLSGLEVLKKYKPAINIAARIKVLGLKPPPHILSKLAGCDQSQS